MGTETQGNGTPQEPQGTGAPQALTTDDVNRIFTARFKAFESKVSTDLNTSIENTLAAHLAKLEEKRGDKSSAPAPGDVKESPEIKSLQKQLSELKNKADRAEADKLAEIAKAQASRVRSSAVEELSKLGIDGQRAKLAIPYLLEQRRLAFEADGGDERIVWRDEHGMSEPLAEGLRKWAATDDAKILIPARGASGSGDRPPGPNGQAPKNATDAARSVLGQAFGGE
jgi:hypothetical protein